MEGGHHHEDMSMPPQQHHQPPPHDMMGQPQGYGNMGHHGGPMQSMYPQQPYGQQQHYGGYGGSWSQPPLPGMNHGVPGVECTDADIVISTGLEHSRTRRANLEYQKLLLANTVLFNNLPSHYQGVHAQHIYHFLTHVRGRRFVQCIAPNVYVPFNNGPYQIAQEITGDPCKMAFSNRNPMWLLDGLETFTTSAEPPAKHTWVHRSNPRGNKWEVVDMDHVREILKEEGPVHLLILPPGIELKHSEEKRFEVKEEESHLKKDNSHDHEDAKQFHDHSDDDHDHPPPPPPENGEGEDSVREDPDENIVQVAEYSESLEQVVVGTVEEHHHHDDEHPPALPPPTEDFEDDNLSDLSPKRAQRSESNEILDETNSDGSPRRSKKSRGQ